jgi:hypothetical protein
VREKRVLSKGLAEKARYRTLRFRPIFPPCSVVFSASWELRQFSTQPAILIFSMACGIADQGTSSKTRLVC